MSKPWVAARLLDVAARRHPLPASCRPFKEQETIVQYMIMAFEDSAAFEARQDPTRSDEYWASWSGYLAALAESRVLSSAGGLTPPQMATTVRLREGRRLVQDGPFAESKEQLGGYFVVEVADLDEALRWAARCPSAQYAGVEVRPLLPPPAG